MDNLQGSFYKYEDSILKSIDKTNLEKILLFLQSEGVEFLEDILENYLDLFEIPYEEFVCKFRQLDSNYKNELVSMINDDVNILEELYTISCQSNDY